MKDFMPVIRKAPIFMGLTEGEVSAVLKCMEVKTESFRKNEFILRAGDSADSVGLLLEGTALVIQEDFWGNRNIITKVTPGRLFAEAFACSPGAVLNVSAIAETECAVMWLNVRRILTTCPTACSHHSHMIRNLLSDLADKNLMFNEKLTHMGKRTTRDKLLSYLSAQAERAAGPEFDIPYSRQQLADYLSVERSAMSAELGRLRDEGVLRFDRNHFTLLGQ